MRTASCQCAQLSVTCPDNYLIHTQCCCKDCQKRTGSPSAFQVHYKANDLTVSGEHKTYTRASSSDASREVTTFFCPECGGTLWLSTSWGESVFGEAVYQVSLGCFEDLDLERPKVAIWCCNLPNWIEPSPIQEFQMDRQPEALGELAAAVESLVKI